MPLWRFWLYCEHAVRWSDSPLPICFGAIALLHCESAFPRVASFHALDKVGTLRSGSSGAAYGAVVQPAYGFSTAAPQQTYQPPAQQWAAQPPAPQQPVAAFGNNPFSVLMRQPADKGQGGGGRMQRDPRSR
jgi:hypothetical protein